jgi:hypothetical protein
LRASVISRGRIDVRGAEFDPDIPTKPRRQRPEGKRIAYSTGQTVAGSPGIKVQDLAAIGRRRPDLCARPKIVPRQVDRLIVRSAPDIEAARIWIGIDGSLGIAHRGQIGCRHGSDAGGKNQNGSHHFQDAFAFSAECDRMTLHLQIPQERRDRYLPFGRAQLWMTEDPMQLVLGL